MKLAKQGGFALTMLPILPYVTLAGDRSSEEIAQCSDGFRSLKPARRGSINNAHLHGAPAVEVIDGKVAGRMDDVADTGMEEIAKRRALSPKSDCLQVRLVHGGKRDRYVAVADNAAMGETMIGQYQERRRVAGAIWACPLKVLDHLK